MLQEHELNSHGLASWTGKVCTCASTFIFVSAPLSAAPSQNVKFEYSIKFAVFRPSRNNEPLSKYQGEIWHGTAHLRIGDEFSYARLHTVSRLTVQRTTYNRCRSRSESGHVWPASKLHVLDRHTTPIDRQQTAGSWRRGRRGVGRSECSADKELRGTISEEARDSARIDQVDRQQPALTPTRHDTPR